jgi:hypothetical protein
MKCCKKFEEATKEGQIEWSPYTVNSASWNMVGCCGHCYMLTIEFCPFCGEKLKAGAENMATIFINQKDIE